MRLSELPAGGCFRVERILLAREVGKRLADMGFNEGRRGVVVRRQLSGGPLQVGILGGSVLIRRSEAEGIEVGVLEGSC